MLYDTTIDSSSHSSIVIQCMDFVTSRPNQQLVWIHA